MMLAAIIVALMIVALLQRETAARGLKSLREEHDFSETVAEPLSPVELILRFSNRSRLPIPFLRYEERLPEGAVLTEPAEEERNHRGTERIRRGAERNRRGEAYADGNGDQSCDHIRTDDLAADTAYARHARLLCEAPDY